MRIFFLAVIVTLLTVFAGQALLAAPIGAPTNGDRAEQVTLERDRDVVRARLEAEGIEPNEAKDIVSKFEPGEVVQAKKNPEMLKTGEWRMHPPPGRRIRHGPPRGHGPPYWHTPDYYWYATGIAFVFLGLTMLLLGP